MNRSHVTFTNQEHKLREKLKLTPNNIIKYRYADQRRVNDVHS